MGRVSSKHWLLLRPFCLRSKIVIFAEFGCLVHKSLTTALTQGERISTDYEYQDRVITGIILHTWDNWEEAEPSHQEISQPCSPVHRGKKKKWVCKHMCAHMCTHVCTHTHICMCEYAYMYAHMLVCVCELYVHTHVYIHVCLYTVMWAYGHHFLIEHILKKQQIKAWMKGKNWH